ncbi:hypothetical protein E1B28_006819 [Marasmius oreades]|uniref:Terpene synthase n=1 Tax=Marasmius oreades TaxID=181124 RepID=A0A9P8AA79_9AGAR|nr:uncharacterized protein E1B28_006819 [Marasmius oreades]KAG7096146.1 hypothetical protein E1B28_006819 [Marasmius oreades]
MTLLNRIFSLISGFQIAPASFGYIIAPPELPCASLDVKSEIKRFLQSVSYETPSVKFDKDGLKEAVLKEIATWNANDGHHGKLYDRIADQAAALVEYSYFHHGFDAKVQFALYSWFMIFIDDLSKRMPNAITEFQHRILLHKPQLDPALEQFPRILGNLYLHWDPICANSMVCAALEFISGTVMEDKKEIETMLPHPYAENWPKFLRSKTGIAPAYSYAVFPRTAHPDMSVYVQVLPDMEDFINLGNDILSFYKEDLAGDEMTYVSFRAKITGKRPLRVLSEMVDEITRSHERILKVLSDYPEALKWWLTFERGYIGWHLSLKRYRLSEIGLQM